MLYYAMLYYTMLYCTYYTMLCYAILYYTILYHAILNYTVLYCTLLLCTILMLLQKVDCLSPEVDRLSEINLSVIPKNFPVKRLMWQYIKGKGKRGLVDDDKICRIG